MGRRSIRWQSGPERLWWPPMNMSLTSGLIPLTLQLLALVAIVVAIGRGRSRQWLLRWLLVAVLVGVAVAAAVALYVRNQGWSAQPVSVGTVFWTGMVGFAVTVLIAGWGGSAWWRRGVALLSVLLVLVCCAAAVNTATGYLPTVRAAWLRATNSQPAQWIDETQLAALQKSGEIPTRGTVVRMSSPSDASGFAHRTEVVYLPPAWFASNPPPPLPTVIMLGGEFGHADDWLLSTSALQALDTFAGLHHGNAPVVVLPDIAGRFNNDTECVDGVRGNAASHLTKDVVPYMISRFGVSPKGENWGIVGWSSGATCALLTAARNPDMFRAFVWLDGTLGPNAGTKEQTIARLFGGDQDAWAAFDPKTVITNYGPYPHLSAWLAGAEDTATVYRPASTTPPSADAIADWDSFSENHATNANKLCTLLSGYNIECSVVGYQGGHDFPSAGAGFAAALPWLAGVLGTPDVKARALPGAPGS
ncbi:S-formylglutathione hydrolase FrmB [Mycolicibacterium sp. BK556]|uniref:alpha/beta hydrolase n=2 Tax=unclassified Mycolicibacterium TaxID=2636767 RepID=UPI0017C800DF|nr:alpha/beta hydrolase-fold protein [Mycolicibacterium sp. BK556]MBB3604933.1 S-formylglutathione hydrolase FrmB [Mycolicibacterium sp. BK556]